MENHSFYDSRLRALKIFLHFKGNKFVSLYEVEHYCSAYILAVNVLEELTLFFLLIHSF